jgi:hypothetical protein
MAWTCEICGRTFARARQSHSCRSRSLADVFTGGAEKWRPLYEELRSQATELLGPFTEHCPSVGVMWKHTATFAVVKFKRNAMEVVFYTDGLRPERNPALWRQISARRTAHLVEVTDDHGFPALLDWIAESFVFTQG